MSSGIYNTGASRHHEAAVPAPKAPPSLNTKARLTYLLTPPIASRYRGSHYVASWLLVPPAWLAAVPCASDPGRRRNASLRCRLTAAAEVPWGSTSPAPSPTTVTSPSFASTVSTEAPSTTPAAASCSRSPTSRVGRRLNRQHWTHVIADTYAHPPAEQLADLTRITDIVLTLMPPDAFAVLVLARYLPEVGHRCSVRGGADGRAAAPLPGRRVFTPLCLGQSTYAAAPRRYASTARGLACSRRAWRCTGFNRCWLRTRWWLRMRCVAMGR